MFRNLKKKTIRQVELLLLLFFICGQMANKRKVQNNSEGPVPNWAPTITIHDH